MACARALNFLILYVSSPSMGPTVMWSCAWLAVKVVLCVVSSKSLITVRSDEICSFSIELRADPQTPKPRNPYIQLPRPPPCPSDRRRCPDPQMQDSESLHSTAPQAAAPDHLIYPSDRRRCPDLQMQESLHTAPQAAAPDH